MKKHKVKREFLDKHRNMRFYAVGDTYEASDADRVKLLQDKGYLERDNPSAKANSKQKPKGGVASEPGPVE